MAPANRSSWKRTGALTLGLALAATLAVACSDSSTDPNGSPDGSYTLQSVNGVPLPVAVFETEVDGITYSEVVTSGEITLSGGTYSGSLAFESRENGTVVDSDVDTFSGSYTVSGNTVILDDGDGEEIVGTFTATSLSVSLDDGGVSITLLFTR